MAYTNFTNCTKEQYESIIYSEEDTNRIRIWFNNVELLDADEYCESFSGTNRILPDDGNKIFTLDNFVAKNYTLILRDLPEETIISDQVKVSIGTLVNENNNTYEDVPIGIFNIQDTPINDKGRVTIKLRDNRVKFDFNYNAQPLIESLGGTATKKQILQDICSQAGVVNNVLVFDGQDDEIGIYDNTISATTYVSYIFEQAGLMPFINREGQLDKINLNDLKVWRIPLSIVEKYEKGTPFKIERVVYESGVIKFETSSDESLQTLYLNAANPYITNEEQIDNIYNLLVGFSADSVKSGRILGNPAIDPFDMILIYDDEINDNPISTSTGTNLTLENTPNASTNIDLLGNTTQETTTGKNLLNIAITGSASSNGINYTINKDKSITLNGTATATFYLNLDNVSGHYGHFTNGQKYTSYLKNAGNNIRLVTRYVSDTTTSLYTSFGDQYGIHTYTGITDKDNFSYITIPNGGVVNNVTVYPMIVKGEYNLQTIGDYEPYTNGASPNPEYPQPIETTTGENTIKVVGKNLFDYNTTSFSNTKVDITTENNTITMTTNEETTSGNLFFMTKIPDEYLENGASYTISSENVSGVVQSLKLQLRNHDGTYVSGKSRADTIVYDSNYSLYVDGNIYSTNNSETIPTGTTAIIKNVMVGKGSTATTYKPYKSQTYDIDLGSIELCKIGDYQDYIYKENGNWYKYNAIGKVVLNGSENWITWNDVSTGNTRLFGTNNYDDIKKIGYIGICNYFINSTTTLWNADTQGMQISATGSQTIRFRINKTLANDLTTFKTWLSTHNTIVYYVLATPTYERITNDELIGQLNRLKTIQTIEGTTNIQQNNSSLPFELNVEYFNESYILKTLANNTYKYTGINRNEFNTEISLEQRKENVSIKSEATYQKIAKTEIDATNASINMITEELGFVDGNSQVIESIKTTQTQNSLDIEAITSYENIDGVRTLTGVKTGKGFTFNSSGLDITDKNEDNTYRTHIDETGTYYYDGETILGQTTNEGSKFKNMELFGEFRYGKENINDNPMFVDKKYTDADGETGVGTFYNGS